MGQFNNTTNNRSTGRGCGPGRGYNQCTNNNNHSNGTNNRNGHKQDQKKKMEFIPNVAGKSQGATYDTAWDHILHEIQKTLKHGEDLADNLHAGNDMGIKESKPTRKRAIKPEMTDEIWNNPARMQDIHEDMRMEQEGLDIECCWNSVLPVIPDS